MRDVEHDVRDAVFVKRHRDDDVTDAARFGGIGARGVKPGGGSVKGGSRKRRAARDGST